MREILMYLAATIVLSVFVELAAHLLKIKLREEK
jgi:hypothetical protein